MSINGSYEDYVRYHTSHEDGPEGHRLWSTRSGGLYIFDRSGDDPLDCDDPPIRIPRANGKIECHDDGMRISSFDGRTVRITATLAAHLVNERDYRLTIAIAEDN